MPQRGGVVVGCLAVVGAVVLLVAGGIIVLAMGGGSSPAGTSAGTAAPDPAPAARAACMQFIRAQAHDPKSLDFGSYWDWTTLRNDDGTWSVGASYSGRNGFNAMRKAYTTCVMRQTAADQWRLESLAQMK